MHGKLGSQRAGQLHDDVDTADHDDPADHYDDTADDNNDPADNHDQQTASDLPDDRATQIATVSPDVPTGADYGSRPAPAQDATSSTRTRPARYSQAGSG